MDEDWSDFWAKAAGMGNMMSQRQKLSFPPDTQLEAQVMDLQVLVAAYAAGNVYKAGDIVTPRPNCNLRGHGLPHVVLEAREPFYTFDSENDSENTTSCAYGRRLDFRIVCMADHGHATPYWAESWQYMPYAGPRPTAQ